MIDAFRTIIAIGLLLLGGCLVFGVLAREFGFVILIPGMVSLVLAHYAKPRSGDLGDLAPALDIMALLIDVPFRVIAWVLLLLAA